MSRKLSTKDYRARFKSFSTFVSWTPPKNLSIADKSRITKAYNEIGRALRGGASIVRSKSSKRVELANKIAGIRTKGMRVAIVRNTPAGSKIRLDGKGQAIETIGKIRRLTLGAEFFMMPDLTDDPDEEERVRKLVQAEARRLIKLSKGASAYSVKYAAGGEGQTFSKDLLEHRLVLQGVADRYNESAAPIGIVAYWFPHGNQKKIIEIKTKQKERRKKAKKRWH